MEKVYVLEGTPVAWARAAPGQYRMWDTQKQIKFNYGVVLEDQHGNLPFYSGPLHLDVIFYFKIPKTRAKHYNDLLLSPHFYVPDLSNLIKLIEDVGTGILYKDDALIAHITAQKKYDERARTEFSLTEIANTMTCAPTRVCPCPSSEKKPTRRTDANK
jgi:Holliday junction resolvase RusA-like endonuclease